MDISNITSDDGMGVKVSCDRCAACCTGGGPILRLADAHLVKIGKIPSKNLYTLRKGELMFDRDKLKMVPLKKDNIKIKIKGESLECIFLGEEHSCEVYSTRPSECRAFKCWDQKEIEMKYDEEPLERADLLSDVEGLWDLVLDHQERCSYDKMKQLTDELHKSGENNEVLEAINEIIRYDISLRKTLVEKANVDPDMLEFLLGRPFTTTMVMFNLKIEEKEGAYCLTPVKK